MFLIIILLAILLIVLGLVALLIIGRYLLQKGEGIQEEEGENILDTLDRRLAAGEIRKDEHERMSRLARSCPSINRDSGDKEK